MCFCISSPIFSSHKLPIVKNIHVICKGLRHFLNLFKKCNVKLSNISILFVCYAEGDNNIFLFSNVFTPGLCLLNELVMFLYMIWGKSESIFCDWLIFSLNYLHWIWIFFFFISCEFSGKWQLYIIGLHHVNRLKYAQWYLQSNSNYQSQIYHEQLLWPIWWNTKVVIMFVCFIEIVQSCFNS